MEKRKATQLGLQGKECPLELAVSGEDFQGEQETEMDF